MAITVSVEFYHATIIAKLVLTWNNVFLTE